MIAKNPHLTLTATKPRQSRRSVVAVDAHGVVRHHFPNVAEAAKLVGRSRAGVWDAIARNTRCGEFFWRFVEREVPVAEEVAPLPAPKTFDEACERAAATPMRNGMRRVSFVWNGRTYLRCAKCRDWMTDESFRLAHTKRPGSVRRSYCGPCDSEMRLEAKRRARLAYQNDAQSRAVGKVPANPKDRHNGCVEREIESPNSNTNMARMREKLVVIPPQLESPGDIGLSPNGIRSLLDENRGLKACRDDTSPSPITTRRGAALPSDAPCANQSGLYHPHNPVAGNAQALRRDTASKTASTGTAKPKGAKPVERGVGLSVAKTAPTDGGHPGRMGYDAAAWAEAEHRGRYERLRQIDPTLTWEDWVRLTSRRPVGRQPKPGGHAEQQAARAKRRAERKAARGGWAWDDED